MGRYLPAILILVLFQADALCEDTLARCDIPVAEKLRASLETNGLQAYLKHHPPQLSNSQEVALTDAEKLSSKAAQKTAKEVLDYISQSDYSAIPRARIEKALYFRMRRYREHPAFLSELKTDLKAYSVFQYLSSSSAFRAAWDMIAYLEETDQFARLTNNDYNLYMRYYKNRNDPEFITVIDRHPQAIQAFEKAFFTREQNEALQTADATIRSIAVSGYKAVPSAIHERDLFAKLFKYRSNIYFLVRLKRDPDAYRVFVEWNRDWVNRR